MIVFGEASEMNQRHLDMNSLDFCGAPNALWTNANGRSIPRLVWVANGHAPTSQGKTRSRHPSRKLRQLAEHAHARGCK